MYFLKMNLDTTVKAISKDDKFLQIKFNHNKRRIENKWDLFSKKLAYLYESLKEQEDYDKPLTELKNEDFFSNVT